VLAQLAFMALHLMRFAFALLVAACIGTLAAAEQPHERQLQEVQALGTVQTPKQPKVVVREWGPKFPSSAGDRKLLAAQSLGTVTAPKEPKAATRAEWGPKFPSTGDRKLLGNANTATPKVPTAVSDGRFERKPGSPSSSASSEAGDRKLLSAQALGTVTTPKQPKIVVREWGPKFPTTTTGDRKLLGAAPTKEPTKPKAISDSRFTSKPGSASSSAATGDRKLLGNANTATPKVPTGVSDSRFERKPGSPSSSASQGDK